MILSRLEMMIGKKETFNLKNELLKLVDIIIKERITSLSDLGSMCITSLTDFSLLGTSKDPIRQKKKHGTPMVRHRNF